MFMAIEKTSIFEFLGKLSASTRQAQRPDRPNAAQIFFADNVQKAAEWIESKRRAHAEKRDLMLMSNTMLKDIGVCRDEINFAFKHGREKDREVDAS